MTLILSGGGVKIFSTLGALLALEEKLNEREDSYIIHRFQRFVGVSSGSIVSLLLALGYHLREIDDIFENTKFETDFKLINLPVFFGLDEAAILTRNIASKIVAKGYPSNLTFKELKEKTDKELWVGVSNINKRKFEFFNCDNTPEMPVLRAIRASFAIPIIFTPVKHDNDFYCDGALIDTFPWRRLNLKDDEWLAFGIETDSSIGTLTSFVSKFQDTTDQNSIGDISSFLANVLDCVIERRLDDGLGLKPNIIKIIVSSKFPFLREPTPFEKVELRAIGYNIAKKSIDMSILPRHTENLLDLD